MNRCFWVWVATVLMFGMFWIGTAQAAFQVPANQGYVTDQAGVLSEPVKAKITQIAKELDQKTHTQIAILTIDSLEETPIEEASLQTARQWGIGDKKSNSGLLMFFAIKDHKLRVEVGYGLEGIITDGTAGEVRDQIFVPHFKQQDYDGGVLNGTVFFAKKIADASQIQLDSVSNMALPQVQTTETTDTTNDRHSNRISPFKIILMLIFLLLLFSRGGGMFGMGWLLASMFGMGMSNSSSRDGGFGSGDGGGFGGFGGGGFGGGGSSGGW